LLESYQLATKQPPPAGHIVVHSQVRSTLGRFRRNLGFRAWWALPGEEFVLCGCVWRPDLGEHYRFQRLGPLVRRTTRHGARPAR
jgi:hypothetical protein